MIQKFRKKPVEIEAIVWNDNFDELFQFMEGDKNYGIVGKNDNILQVRTLEGIMEAQPGDYIIKGVKGEFYPCKPDIFAMTYDVVEKVTTGVSERELTFGEKLVGLTFNPAGDPDVNKAKQLCAELADLVNKCFYQGKHGDTPLGLQHQLFYHTTGEILNAQMNVVKVLTLKY